ncbi:MAG TPA: cellulose synthase family protein [Elusimicrobiota bacterium]|nr:cellulose synthase family protein [Elusimicrobiota bacterium]
MHLFSQWFMGFYLGLVALLSLYGIHRYWILYLYFRYYKWAAPRSEPALPDPLPPVTIQLPIFNERYVVERLINAVCALDYPRELLEIQVLDDSTDDTRTIAQSKVDDMRARGYNIARLHRLQRSGFKAGALSAGLAKARGKFLAIFDADFMPPREFLRKTLPHFGHSDVGMVQTRWGHLNENFSLLTWVQSIFLDGHFLLEHTARNRSGAFFNFNGTAGIWRREAIESSGGWQHDTLTEDLDLSYRAQMQGWKFVFLPDVVCPAELPVDINAFKTQQNRWTMGAIQTAKKMLPTIWRSSLGWKIKVEATFHLTACAGYILMAALSMLLPISLYLRQQSQWPLTGALEMFALAATTISLGLFYAVCQRDLYPNWKSRMINLPLLISIGVGMCLSNAKAVLQGMTTRRFEFRRTPKYSVVQRGAHWKLKRYRTGNPLAGAIEFGFAAYFVVAFFAAIALRQWVSVPFIVLFGFGYAYVAFLTAWHGLASWTRPIFPLTFSSKALSD